MTSLTDVERAMLEFETKWWKHPGARDQAIRDTFDLTVTAYTQRLVALIRRPEAEEVSPVVVRRLRRKLTRRHSVVYPP